MRRLVAALACRNQGTRLYGKPLQNLDVDKRISILEYMINSVRTYSAVDQIVLGISEGADNHAFIEFAKSKDVKYIVGDEENVLLRLIQCAESVDGTDVFRLTTESPFTYFEVIDEAWRNHVTGEYDFSYLDNLPDGSGFEILKLSALQYSHTHGERRHRSELCSLYIRENKTKFKMNAIQAPKNILRTDIRLTVDYPEDLVLCRAVYQKFKEKAPRIPLGEIIDFLDENPNLKALVSPYVEEGLKTMYL